MIESQYGHGVPSSGDQQEHAKFVIADRFEETDVAKTESDVKKHFDIEKRYEITLNVRHACKLQRRRRADLVRKALSNKVRDYWLDVFEQLVEQAYSKDDERDQSKYYIYVLRHKQE